jgi:ribosomal protein S18 acetylase RimI-like enzyme
LSGKFVGVLISELKSDNLHRIQSLFVDKAYHRRGISRTLFDMLLADLKALSSLAIVVNASLYAADAYRKLGFVDLYPFVNNTGRLHFIEMLYKRTAGR